MLGSIHPQNSKLISLVLENNPNNLILVISLQQMQSMQELLLLQENYNLGYEMNLYLQAPLHLTAVAEPDPA